MSPWTGYPPLPMFRRQMVNYVCAWIPMTSVRPSAEIITRCPLWMKLLTSLHTLATSLLLLHQVGHLPWILVNRPSPGVQPAYDIQQSLWKIPFPATSLWPHLFPRHLSEEDGPDPTRMPRMHWNCRHHHPQLH